MTLPMNATGAEALLVGGQDRVAEYTCSRGSSPKVAEHTAV